MYLVASVCLCVGLLRVHYTPVQRYMGYLCTRKAQYAPSGRNMHHGAQWRLCFLKNSGDPDDFLGSLGIFVPIKIGGAECAFIPTKQCTGDRRFSGA